MLDRSGVSSVFVESYLFLPSLRRLCPGQWERPYKVTDSSAGRSFHGSQVSSVTHRDTWPQWHRQTQFFLFYFVFAHAQSFNKATATGQYTWTPISSKWLYPRMLWSAYCLLRQLSSGGGWQACNKTHSGLWSLESPEPLIPACVGEEGSQLKPLKNFQAYNGLRAVWKVRTELRS